MDRVGADRPVMDSTDIDEMLQELELVSLKNRKLGSQSPPMPLSNSSNSDTALRDLLMCSASPSGRPAQRSWRRSAASARAWAWAKARARARFPKAVSRRRSEAISRAVARCRTVVVAISWRSAKRCESEPAGSNLLASHLSQRSDADGDRGPRAVASQLTLYGISTTCDLNPLPAVLCGSAGPATSGRSARNRLPTPESLPICNVYHRHYPPHPGPI